MPKQDELEILEHRIPSLFTLLPNGKAARPIMCGGNVEIEEEVKAHTLTQRRQGANESHCALASLR